MTTLEYDPRDICPRCRQTFRQHFNQMCPDGRSPHDAREFSIGPLTRLGPFADTPVTVGELRAELKASAAEWSPRDALLQLLREIDNGLDVGALVVTYSVNNADGSLGHAYGNACPDNFVALGLLARASFRLQE